MRIEEIKEYKEKNGITTTLFWLTSKFLSKIFSIFYQAIDYHIALIYLDRLKTDKIENEKQFDIRQLQTDDLKMIETKLGKPVSDEFAERLKNSKCCLIFRHHNLAGYSWYSDKLLKNEGVEPFLIDVYPKKGFIYIYKTFIFSQERMKGVCTELYRHLLLEFQESDFKGAFLFFNKNNMAMRSLTARLGFYIIGEINYRRYLWVEHRDTSILDKIYDSEVQK